MPLYENGLIYKLFKQDDYDNKNIYIGSTTNFRGRKRQHKESCNNPNDEKYNRRTYQYIRDNGGFENWCMIQIEPFPCNSKKDLETRERYWIDIFKPKLNIIIPTRTKKEYYIDNREKILEKVKEYRENNVEKISAQKKIYKENNKEKISAKGKEKVICECGCEIAKNSLLAHKKSKKHQKLMGNI